MKKIIFLVLVFVLSLVIIGCTKQAYDTDSSQVVEPTQIGCEETDCLGEQTCVDGKCVEPTCNECQYLDNHVCTDYACCDNKDCNDDNPKTEDICLNPKTKEGSCSNTRMITNLCEDYYAGEVCDGFCFADLTWQCEVQGGKRIVQQEDLTIEIIFPQYVNTNSEYTLKFNFDNKGTKSANYQISKIQTGDRDTTINQNYNIAAGESKTVIIKAMAPTNPGFQKNIFLYQGDMQSVIYIHLIVNNPNEDVSSCGSKKYNTDFAVCKDGILYPTLFPSCYDKSDCIRYPDRNKCLANTCYERIGVYKDWEDREYDVEVIPLYINVDGAKSEPNKETKKQAMDQEINKLNDWFTKEKEYWKYNGNFNIKWSSSDYCTFNDIDEFVDLMEETKTQDGLYTAIRAKCGDLTKDMHGVYYIWSTGTPGSGSEFERYNEAKENYVKSAGLSMDNGKIFVFYPDFLTLLHETLHGFGANDLYHYDADFKSTAYGQYYQWNDCQIYNQNPQPSVWEKDVKPHLCVLEAEAVGIAS